MPPDLEDGTREGNGHARYVPAWGDVEHVPLPSPRRGLWGRLMTTRPVRAIADYAQAERRPVPAWVPTTIVLLSMAFVTNLGIFMYWKSDVDNFMRNNATAHDDVLKLKIESTALNKDYEALLENVGLWILYESKIRELISSGERITPKDLPPTPPWPKRHGNVPDAGTGNGSH